jgi:UDP-2,4-diacetamido-2,4,6-trideoxy-beta-L-altropyranose hydrolase
MNSLNVFFRIDASSEIGFGHLSRCSVLAKELQKRGYIVSVITKHPSHIEKFLVKKSIEGLHIIPLVKEEVSLKKLLESYGPHILIVDNYSYDSDLLFVLNNQSRLLVYIHDKTYSNYPVDIYVNPNFGTTEGTSLTDKGVKYLIGTKYSLVHEEFTEKSEVKNNNGKTRCLICFGGSDPGDATNVVLSLLEKSAISQVNVDLVLGPGYRGKISEKNVQSEYVSVFRDPKNMREIIQKADFALVPPSTLFWEAALTKTPAMTLTIASNHEDIGNALGEAGYAIHLGAVEYLNEHTLKESFNRLLDPQIRSQMKENISSLLDGKGPSRIADVIEKTAQEKFLFLQQDAPQC